MRSLQRRTSASVSKSTPSVAPARAAPVTFTEWQLRHLAWIVEKFRSWTDNDGTIESVISRDDLLTNISLYWFSGAIGSSFFPYFARMHRPWPIPDGKTIDVPMGYAEFPREILSPPRSLAERTYTRIERWTKMEKGGHFAALEQTAFLYREIDALFR